MKINTFIVILFITFIICNSNNHLKGEEIKNIDARDTGVCLPNYAPFVDSYKEITSMTSPLKAYVNKRRLVKVDETTADTPIYTYYSYPTPTAVPNNAGQFQITGTKTVDFTMTSGAPTGVMNYEFPWNVVSPPAPYNLKFGSITGDIYEFECTPGSSRNSKLLEVVTTKLGDYENIDQYMEVIPEPRNDITDEVIGQGIKLNMIDTGVKNYNMLLTKEQFCHYSCSINTNTALVECDLLVYPKSKYNTNPINKAYIINIDGKAKSFIGVKADTATLADTCADGGANGPECTKPQYTIMLKGTDTKVLTGYYKNVMKKYSVSTAESPVMPDDIKAKFADYKYCFEIPKVQGVSNMFINSILLILIVILMI